MMYDYQKQAQRQKRNEETLDLLVCIAIAGLAVFVLYRWLS